MTPTPSPTPTPGGLSLEASINSIRAAGPNGALGDVLRYQYIATNVGDVAIASPVRIVDSVASDESCPALSAVGNLDDTFDPGESIVCRATHAITESDLAFGTVTNNATARAGGFTSNTSRSTATVVHQNIRSSEDDVEELDTGLGATFQQRSNDLDFSEGYTIGLRYPVCIPRGSAIASATIMFTADEFDGESPVTFADIWAERGSGIEFSSGNGLRSRSRTLASVPWRTSSIVQAWNPGTSYHTPSLEPIIEEAVAAPNWPAGPGCAGLVFIIDSRGDGIYGPDYRQGRGDREAVAFDNDGPHQGRSPLLELIFVSD